MRAAVLLAIAACATTPAPTPAVARRPLPPPARVDPARALADRVIEAAGGRARLGAVHVLYLVGEQVSTHEGKTTQMPFVEWLGDDPDAPGSDRARVELSMESGHSWIEAHRAAGGWLSQDRRSPYPELEDQLATALETTWRDRLVFHLLDPATDVKAAPDEVVDGRTLPAIVVSRPDGGAKTTIIVDPDDGRIVRAHWPSASGRHTFAATYDDVREVDGVRLPFKTRAVVDDDPSTFEETSTLFAARVGDAAPAVSYDRP